MFQLIKKRLAKKSDRGIYLQDQELKNTHFSVGSHFSYEVNLSEKKVIIKPSTEQTGNTVSKRNRKNVFAPVIDIRNKKALSAFDKAESLQIHIYENEIVVEAITGSSKSGEKTKFSISKSLQNKYNLAFRKSDLQEVVGETYQYSLDDFLVTDLPKPILSNVKKAIENLHIPLQVLSLFSGAGLFDKAFVDSGFEVVFALEKDPDIAKTYEYNLGNVTVADITKVDKSKLPFAPVIIGGSPCKGFSNSNRISNYLDNPNNLLVKEYIETVKQVNPYIFILENVPQLLTAGKGMFMKEIEEELQHFKITKQILTASDYGDPQVRKRAIIIGSRLGVEIKHPTATVKPSEYQTVRQAFKGLHSLLANQKDISKSRPESLERIKHVPVGGNVHDIPIQIRPKGVHSDMYKRLEWNKPSITIVNPRKAMLLHPEENRILSIREACRLFSLPDNFIFKGPLSKMQESIANGIPLKLGTAIANTVKKALHQFNSKVIPI